VAYKIGVFGDSVVLNLRRDRSGSAVTEFALVLPLLTLLLFGIVEFGSITYSYSAMQFGANRAARSFAVNTLDEAGALARAKAVLPAWAREQVALTMVQSDPGDPNTNVIRVTLSVDASRVAVVSMMTRLVELPLRAETSVKQELPYVD
jgi:Flp pilus assembly protein TadG